MILVSLPHSKLINKLSRKIVMKKCSLKIRVILFKDLHRRKYNKNKMKSTMIKLSNNVLLE